MATIRKRGSKWHVQVRRQGHPPATKSFLLKSDAEAWARKVEAQLDRGQPLELPAPPLTMTLRALLERYRDTIIPHKRSAKNEASALAFFLKESMCNLPLSQIGPEHFAEYRDRRLLTVKPATVCRTLAIIHHALETAIIEWRLPISANPLKSVTRPRLNNQRVRRISTAEFESIDDALKATRNPFVASALGLAVETGMRRSELTKLAWQDVDLANGVAYLPLTKNGLPRTVPLTPAAIEILRQLKSKVTGASSRVLPISVNALRLAWQRLRRRAGVSDLRFHDFRHEAISRFFEKELSLPEVALMSGHKDLRMLMRYTHLSSKMVSQKLKNRTNSTSDRLSRGPNSIPEILIRIQLLHSGEIASEWTMSEDQWRSLVFSQNETTNLKRN